MRGLTIALLVSAVSSWHVFAEEAAPPAVAAAVAAGDFGAQLVGEAVDLSAAHGHNQDAVAKDMESLLHWAIEHSDHERLRQQAEDIQKLEAIKDFKEGQQRVAELSDLISQQPTEAQLMQSMIAVLDDTQATAEQKQDALAELQVLVEPIDNANDLKVLGGLTPLVQLLGSSEVSELQEGAAYVLGTAASNNAELVGVLMKNHPELIQQLLQLAGALHDGTAAKAMYALGVLVRSPVPEARTTFYSQAGLSKLQNLMSPSSKAAKRVKSKALNLIADLIEMTANGDDTSLSTWDDKVMAQFAAAALDLLMQADALDGKEKALMAMRVLLLRRGHAGRTAMAEEGAEAVLREVLTELDLLVDTLESKKTAAASVAHAGATSTSKWAPAVGSGSQDAPASTDTVTGGQEMDGEDDMSDVDRHMYAQYVAHLCADVLHHLSIQHIDL